MNDPTKKEVSFEVRIMKSIWISFFFFAHFGGFSFFFVFPFFAAVSVMDISELDEDRQTINGFHIGFKLKDKLLLKAETREEFVKVLDGLRCLIGLEMQTPEMSRSLDALSEVKALQAIYTVPPKPAPPANFNFLDAGSE
jgi:hypothetical protein